MDLLSIKYRQLQAFVAAWDRARKGEEGQGLVEYALILFFVSIAAIVGLTAIGVEVNDLLCLISDKIGDACA